MKRRDWVVINVGTLNSLPPNTELNPENLAEFGLHRSTTESLRILGNGDFSKKLNVTAKWYSKSALEKITKAGGAANNLKGEAFAFPKPKKKFIPRDKPAVVSKKKKGGDDEAAPEGGAAAAPKAEAPKSDAPSAE